MVVKVLHVFSPSLRTRFGGQNVTWKYNFNFWNEPIVEHYCLEVFDKKVQPAIISFDFEYPAKQSVSTKMNRGLWSLKLIDNLQRVAKDYDIIHFHILWWGTLLAATWAQKKRIPTIYESVLLDADTPGNILKEHSGKVKFRLLKNFSSILAISDFLSQDYLEHGFDQKQVVTLMNSVDISLFHPSSDKNEKTSIRQLFGLPENAMIVIFVGSIIHRKGVDVLVEAFLRLCKKRPDVYLLLVGPQNKKENPSLDEKWVDLLKKRLVEEGVDSKVNFLGLMSDRKTLADLYRASDIFVFPSRVEGLGNVILEAMASGLPIVVSDLPVFKGVVENNTNGITVPLEDASSTESAMMELINNPETAKQYAERAREFAIQKFSFSSWQSRLVEVYRNLTPNENKNE